MAPSLSLTFKIWRQASADCPGALETHHLEGLSPDLSLLEALDVLNELSALVARKFDIPDEQ